MEHFIAFLIYSYLGATIEHISYYIGSFNNDYIPKSLGNPIITGFPLYGIGAYLVILAHSQIKQSNILIQFLIYGLVLSILEYLIGMYVGAGPNSYDNEMISAWDYSEEKYNIGGKISLRHFVSWGILGTILTKIHPVILNKIKFGIKN